MTALLSNALSVVAIPAFNDNYIWLIHDGRYAAVVDPGDAAPVIAALKTYGLELSAILLTHHHADHVGGVQTLLEHTSVPVFAPAREVIADVTKLLKQGDVVDVPQLPLRVSVLDVPGHTNGHIAYVAEQQKWLFCGDTLFAGGCGRLFEGTPAQMITSLSKLSTLPPDTQVFCAHEYTLSNLRFAQAVEPGNMALTRRIATEQAKRDQDIPTVPSSIAEENATNPFLRYQKPEIIASLLKEERLAINDKGNPVAAFAALRLWKNNYK
ncbi:hydroxyacylglutathione hydrolase [Glaciimonas immobilis]|uniref:Hydroxyacylglutathione hydrolase n=1 Tax=Glaciimonas immobilis TaxID=728004 RepID=A0A840RQP2_9BURK|nr:hydroxyacylglutathione hydrolase [Glaciimonas immobilis]KAF3998012.1 hydroxyacylglutathione hydrolase [Glaciimonas immobilis]MBB5199308.1 hydroxyacylglutathione hydrolase [Glaciimonas immobilis]